MQTLGEWLCATARPDQQRLALGIIRNCTMLGVTLSSLMRHVVACAKSETPAVCRQAAKCLRVGIICYYAN